MQPEVLQKHLIMMNYLARSNMAYNDKRDEQVWRPQGDQSAEVSNMIVLPEVEDNSAKLLQESTPQGKPLVGAWDRAKIRNAVDPVRKINAITDEQDVNNTLANAKATAINEYNADKAERDKQAKADAEAREQEEQEAKHRKAEKMWSAIGDGISAIANMATVGAGADSMYNPADSLHSKVKSKWDEIKANKQAIAAAENKARMDLLLKDLELGARAKEAEANRNFNIWKVGTEEEGKNQRAKDRQAFDAEQNKLKNEATINAAKIRGRSGGGGEKWKPYGTHNGKTYYSQAEWESAIMADATDDEITTAEDWDGRIDYTKLKRAVDKRLNQPKATENKKNTMSIYD